MGKLSMLLTSIVILLSIIEAVASSLLLTENYVATNNGTKCLDKNRLRHHCLRFEEYGRQPDEYFTIFYFESGRHLLNISFSGALRHGWTIKSVNM